MRVIEREIPYRGRGTELRIYPLADIWATWRGEGWR